MKPSVLLVAATAGLVQSASMPTTGLVSRQQRPHVQSLCDLYAYWSGSGYELLNNLWGKDTATSGSQCTYLDGTAGGGIQCECSLFRRFEKIPRTRSSVLEYGRLGSRMEWLG